METPEEEIIAPAGPETANDDEKTLIEKFKIAKEEFEISSAHTKSLSKTMDDLNDKLLSLLKDEDKKASAKYEGLGHVVRMTGAAHASIEKGRQGDVIAYLHEIGRSDMIKAVVQPATLSTYVRECLKQNAELPPGVTFYKPEYVNFYPAK